MKLNETQINSLQIINEEISFDNNDSRIHGNTLIFLFKQGLIVSREYANGEHWELTDKGIEKLEEHEN